VSLVNESQKEAPLKLASPLLLRFETSGVLKSEFKITKQEEELILQLFHSSKLTPNLTLFDILFFHLHKDLHDFKALLEEKDFDHLIAELEFAYANVLDSQAKEVAPFKKFLDQLLNILIRSNTEKEKKRGIPPEQIGVILRGNTQAFFQVFKSKINLFDKFLTSTDSQSLLFKHRIELYAGCEQMNLKKCSKKDDIFPDNASFFLTVFRSLCRKRPELMKGEADVLQVAEIIRAFSLFSRISHQEIQTMVTNVPHTFDALPIISNFFINSLPFYLHAHQTYIELNNQLVSIEQERYAITNRVMTHESTKYPIEPFSDLLGALKAKKIIPETFRLTASETKLLQDLFFMYPLSSNWTLFDILGFAIHDHLEKLREKIPHSCREQLTDLQGLISTQFLFLMIGFRRITPSNLKLLGPVNQYTTKYAYPPDKFLTEFHKALSLIENVICLAKPTTATQQRMHEKLKAAGLDAFKNTIFPLKDIVTKFLQLENSKDPMLLSLSQYGGSEALDRETKEAFPCLQSYCAYIKQAYEYAIRNRLLGAECSFDSVSKEALARSLTKPTETANFKRKIVNEIYRYQVALTNAMNASTAAIEGQLDHKTWLSLHHIKMESEKSQPIFVELLFNIEITAHMLISFFVDMLDIMETRFFPKTVLQTQFLCNRTVYTFAKWNDQAVSTSDIQLPQEAVKKITTLSTELKHDVETTPGLFKLIDKFVSNREPIYRFWIELLMPQKEHWKSLYEKSLCSLTTLKEELTQELKKEWSTLSLENLKTIDPALVRESIFQKSLPLVRPVLMITDCLGILQERRCEGNNYSLPRELVDILELDGIDELLKELMEAKTAPPEPKPLPIPEPSPVVVKKIPSPQKRKEKKQHVPAASKPKAPLPPPIPIIDLAYETKSRKILERLKELGFIEVRKKGSHHILHSARGGQVVVPENSELPPGTVRSIAKQAASALYSEKKAETG